MDRVQFVRETWEAISNGDLQPVEAALAPDAKWRAVVDGRWNCDSRDAILVSDKPLGERSSAPPTRRFGQSSQAAVISAVIPVLPWSVAASRSCR